ncbi:hypothetical protein SAMN06269185_1939 [Natronoarchaeum philippinense]|uniref:Uncharacterized protein n=1 Tax=Natronoarchaeum philippinense TaxID=558529 RepID=A0A285NY59_NATPI|nr:hypothetical protein [Natronoarchaeum philippinense]SNZ12816.1 hypothetical protein SAMN06269185_1939 [Natronoarchaeum philippinense]
MLNLQRYVERFLVREGDTPIFRCTGCGCTYGSNNDSCTECWSGRLVRVE